MIKKLVSDVKDTLAEAVEETRKRRAEEKQKKKAEEERKRLEEIRRIELELKKKIGEYWLKYVDETHTVTTGFNTPIVNVTSNMVYAVLSGSCNGSLLEENLTNLCQEDWHNFIAYIKARTESNENVLRGLENRRMNLQRKYNREAEEKEHLERERQVCCDLTEQRRYRVMINDRENIMDKLIEENAKIQELYKKIYQDLTELKQVYAGINQMRICNVEYNRQKENKRLVFRFK